MKTVQEIRRHNFEELASRYESQRSLADVLDITPGYVNQMLNGYRSIGEKTARKIEARLSLPNLYLDIENPTPQQPTGAKTIESNAEWLGGFETWDNDTPLRDDEVELPFFREVELAAGNGRSEIIENHGLKLRFAKSTLKKQNVDPASAACVTVSGNSMEPVLPDGATIGIDTSKRQIKDGDIYAIDHDGHLRVKVLYRLPGGKVRLRSFNSDEWPDELVTQEEFKILGRVFWWSVLR